MNNAMENANGANDKMRQNFIAFHSIFLVATHFLLFIQFFCCCFRLRQIVVDTFLFLFCGLYFYFFLIDLSLSAYRLLLLWKIELAPKINLIAIIYL